MPQFLSSTTTSTTTSSAAVENGSSAASSPLAKTIQNKSEEPRSYHHSHSIHQRQHVVGGDVSSDGGVHGEYSEDELEVEEEERKRGTKNGYHLKISNLETVSRTPKEHFSDQVGFLG